MSIAATTAASAARTAATVGGTVVYATSTVVGGYEGAKATLKSVGGDVVLTGASALADRAVAVLPPEATAKAEASAAAASVAAAAALDRALASRDAGAAAGTAAVVNSLNALFAKLPPAQQNAWVGQRARLVQQAELAKAKALDLSEPLMDKALEKLGVAVKRAAGGERDMPRLLVRLSECAVDSIWPDVRVELKEKLQGLVLKTKVDDDDAADNGSGVCASGLPPWWSPARWRAWFLHHYLPHDKGPWTSLRRDPVHALLTLVTLVPVFGVRFAFHALLLALLALPGGRDLDEFQLVKFVLKFKGTQFLSGGLILALQGALSLYQITTFTDASSSSDGGGGGVYDGPLSRALATRAPGVGEGFFLGTLDFAGGVVLGWAALVLLPCSQRLGAKATLAETAAARRDRERDAAAKAASTCGCVGRRGGRLAGMLKVDVGCFCVALLALVCVCALNGFALGSWQAATTLFWCRTLYSLSTAPFFAFMLPVLSSVLTHARPTGFNRYGRCVPFRLPPLPASPPSSHLTAFTAARWPAGQARAQELEAALAVGVTTSGPDRQAGANGDMLI